MNMSQTSNTAELAISSEPEVERSLFPLPLAPFEKYMMLDDHERQPMAFVIRLYFSGRFDEAAFQQAVQRAITRHPLLRSLVVGESFRRWKWQPVAAPPIKSPI